jgi:hypothetical protein
MEKSDGNSILISYIIQASLRGEKKSVATETETAGAARVSETTPDHETYTRKCHEHYNRTTP